MTLTSVTDARVRTTRGRLRAALISLIHEKNYEAIVVLNWWVDTQSPLSPREIDDVFLTLVATALAAAGQG